MMSENNLLSINNLRKSYRKGDAVLDALSLTVVEHEIVALVGNSGSGKSTLLRIIAGLESIDDGCVTINGVIANKVQKGTAAVHMPPEERKVGLIFQEGVLFPHLTVYKNILFGLYDWHPSVKKARAAELLALLKISDLADRYPHQISGGQAQRAAIARAIAPRPHLLLLDEPFNNLDVALREDILPDLHALIKHEGISALCITHLPQEAFAIADRIAVLHRGIIEQCAKPQQIYRHPVSCRVANFFGTINSLPVTYNEQDNQIDLLEARYSFPLRTPLPDTRTTLELLVRPDVLEIFSVDEQCRRPDMLLIPARISSVTYFGHYNAVAVFPTDSKQRIYVHITHDLHVNAGDDIQIGIPTRQVQIVNCE